MRRLLWLGLLFLTFQVGAQDIFPYTPSGWDGNIVISSVTGTNTNNTDLKEGFQLYLDYALRHDFSSALDELDIDIQIDGVQYTRRVFSSLNPDPTFGQGLDLILVLEKGTHTVTIILDPDDEFAETDETNNSYELTVSVSEEHTFNPVASTDPESLEYFIDDDPGYGNGTAVSLSASDSKAVTELDIDLGSTSTGFHQAYFRSRNSNDWGFTQVLNFFNLQAPDTTVTGIEYFIDSDPGLGNGTFIASTIPDQEVDLNFTVPLTDVAVGFHQLYTRAKSGNGTWSPTQVLSFFNFVAPSEGIEYIEYFVDDDPGLGNGTPISFTSGQEEINFNLDLSNVNTGFHQIHVRARSSNGTWGLLESSSFLVEQGAGRNTDIVALEYFFISSSTFSQVFTYEIPEASTDIDIVAPLDISFLEDGENYTLVVRAVNESGTKSVRSTHTFTYMENTAPEIADQSFTTDENPLNDASIGQVEASDADNDELTYSIVSGNEDGAFSLSSSGELTIADSTLFNFENVTSYSLTVAVDDSKERSEAVVTVNISDINDTPTVTDQAFNLIENPSNGIEIGQIVASDEDEDELSFTLSSGNENDAFALSSSGILSVQDSTFFNFESTTSFSLTVVVSDGEVTASATITVNLEETNDAPVIADQTFSLAENPTNGTIIGQITASDEDEDELTFSISSGNENEIFSLSGSGSLTVLDSTPLDFETTLSFDLEIEVTDGMESASAIVTVALENVNEAPVIENQTFSIDENSDTNTVVGQIAASDVEGDALTFALLSGNSNEAFALSSAGELTVLTSSALDFETQPSFELQIQVSDGNDGTSEAQITITLNDVAETGNMPPSFSNVTFSVDENSAAGTIVGQLEATDTDGDELTYVIQSGNTDDAFVLSTTGELSVQTASALDFETQPTFTLQVQVSDGNEGTTEGEVTINLNDVAENNPPQITNQTFDIDENSPNGKLVGTIVATDPDGDELTFVIQSGNTDDAFLLSSTGELSVQTASALDFEAQPTLTLQVQVSDGNGGTAEGQVTINLNDVTENNPPQIANQTFNIEENSANGTLVGTIIATDPDGDELTYSITSGNEAGTFSLNGTSGELTVANVDLLDFETVVMYELRVQVSDGTVIAASSITINVLDLDEPVLSTLFGSDIKVYPNPVSEYLTIEWVEFQELVVYNLVGRQLLHSYESSVSLEGLSAGTYLLLLKGRNGTVLQQKILKR
ncbi:MAG: cadherin domain-containing protein [Cytophagales bacterium]|nr:cadherin domain-containing protein [Cytophagales bacterium]